MSLERLALGHQKRHGRLEHKLTRHARCLSEELALQKTNRDGYGLQLEMIRRWEIRGFQAGRFGISMT
jgi:hypothetical protein